LNFVDYQYFDLRLGTKYVTWSLKLLLS